MEKDGCIYDAYVKILNAELVPAMSCTDPIVIAYCAAKAKQALGCMPETLDLYVSGNLVKNAKCVVVPGTGGLIGMRAAAASRKKRSFSEAKWSLVSAKNVGKRETSKSASRTQSVIQVAGSTSMS